MITQELFAQYHSSVLERFLRYVRINTQSDPFSRSSPSTACQLDLARLLAAELRSLGISDAHSTEHGFVYGTVPGNIDTTAPTIFFCSHLDTSFDCSGENVKPQVIENYDGRDLQLPGDPSQVLRVADHPALQHEVGRSIVTSDGTTLLGGDDKSGIAAIMDAVQFLQSHPQIKHGPLKILFTPDEEIGHGTENIDLTKVRADFGYTLDADGLGTFEDENYFAQGLTLRIKGNPVHSGYATGKLENALKIGAEILARLPKDKRSPEVSCEREGFIHPTSIQGKEALCEIRMNLRDFEFHRLDEYAQLVQALAREVLANYPRSSYSCEIVEQYRNMKEIIERHPQVRELALRATREAGITPCQKLIRGGTDGAMLSHKGLPCPNLFSGQHGIHSLTEWVSVYSMQKAAEVMVRIVAISVSAQQPRETFCLSPSEALPQTDER